MQITRSGLVLRPVDDLKHWESGFARDGWVRFSDLLDPGLLAFLDGLICRATFDPMTHGNISRELCMRPNRSLDLLYFLMNDPKVFRVLEQVTRCGTIGSFIGRVYRMLPGSDHHDSWHADLRDHRILGLSVNLSPQPYEGGALQLRDRSSKMPISEAVNTGLGDAIVFRIASDFEHQVTPVTGILPKTAFAGWFRSKPDFLTLLRSPGDEQAAEERLHQADTDCSGAVN